MTIDEKNRLIGEFMNTEDEAFSVLLYSCLTPAYRKFRDLKFTNANLSRTHAEFRKIISLSMSYSNILKASDNLAAGIKWYNSIKNL